MPNKIDRAPLYENYCKSPQLKSGDRLASCKAYVDQCVTQLESGKKETEATFQLVPAAGADDRFKKFTYKGCLLTASTLSIRDIPAKTSSPVKQETAKTTQDAPSKPQPAKADLAEEKPVEQKPATPKKETLPAETKPSEQRPMVEVTMGELPTRDRKKMSPSTGGEPIKIKDCGMAKDGTELDSNGKPRWIGSDRVEHIKRKTTNPEQSKRFIWIDPIFKKYCSDNNGTLHSFPEQKHEYYDKKTGTLHLFYDWEYISCGNGQNFQCDE